MTPSKIPELTPEQRLQRQRAEAMNTAAIQDELQQQTSFYRRFYGPRVSIATGRSFNAIPLR